MRVERRRVAGGFRAGLESVSGRGRVEVVVEEEGGERWLLEKGGEQQAWQWCWEWFAEKGRKKESQSRRARNGKRPP